MFLQRQYWKGCCCRGSRENCRHRRRSTLKRTSQLSQEVKAAESRFGICLRRSSLKSFSIVTESTGSPRLVNSIASGNITFAVDLVEVKQNVPQDDAAIEDNELNALVILRSATPFSADELGECNDDGPVSVCDADPPVVTRKQKPSATGVGFGAISLVGQVTVPLA